MLRVNSSRRSLVYGLAATLCVLAPLVVFLTANNYTVFAAEVLPLYIVGLGAGLLVATLKKLQLVIIARLALWGCLFTSLAFLYGLNTITQAITVASACGIAVAMLRDDAATVVLIAAALHIGSTIGLSVLTRPADTSTTIQTENQPAPPISDLPSVVHLVLDEFTGLRGLPSELPGSRELMSSLVNYYPANDFELFSHAYSQYIDTHNSLPNLVNFTSSATTGTYTDRVEGAFTVTRNKYFDHLSKLGYSLHIYQSNYLNFCNTPNVPVTTCSSYENNSIAAIADIDIPDAQKTRFILNSYLDSSEFLRKIRSVYQRVRNRRGNAWPSWPSGNSRVGPLAVLPTIGDLENALRDIRPGEFYFGHLTLPHYPYVLNSDCSVKEKVNTWLNIMPFENTGTLGQFNGAASRAERYAQYIVQINCTQTIVAKLFAAIRASGQWERSIIIIHGDHGSRIRRRRLSEVNIELLIQDDYRDAYSTFFAAKNGASVGQLIVTPMSLQSLVAKVWQIPYASLDQHQVYLENDIYEELELAATPLLGFGPITDLETHHVLHSSSETSAP